MIRPGTVIGLTAACTLGLIASPAQDLSQVEALISQGLFREALARLDDAAGEAQAEPAAARYLASRAWDGLDDPVRAAAQAQAAIDLAPRNTLYRMHMGQLLLRHDNAPEALELFNEALEIEPENPVLSLGRGLSLNQLNRYDESAEAFTRCLSLNPALGLALDGLMEAHLQRVLFEEARAAAQDFLDANPDEFRGYYYLALAKEKLGATPEELEPLLTRSLERNGRFAPAHTLLGTVLLDMGRAQEAVLSLEGAVRLDPEHRAARINLARAYRAVGRSEAAKRQIEALEAIQQKRDQVAPALRRAGTPQ